MQNLPTPLDMILDPISLTVLSIYLVLILWETARPARKLPEINNWKLKGFLSFFLFFYLSSYLPIWIDPILSRYTLFDLSGLGTLGGAVIGVLCYQLVFYIYHRCVHRYNSLWKVLHQMHHSAERLDTFGAFYFSPVEMISFTFISSFVFAFAIGLSPKAITLVILALNFFSVFQHANIRTPRWLGYVVQRPESHSVHHAKGIHRYNYSDVPIWDILFGTFRNPKTYQNEAGFYDGASSRIKDMLLFKDINQAK